MNLVQRAVHVRLVTASARDLKPVVTEARRRRSLFNESSRRPVVLADRSEQSASRAILSSNDVAVR